MLTSILISWAARAPASYEPTRNASAPKDRAVCFEALLEIRCHEIERARGKRVGFINR
jgi:hypothetical protein